MIRRFVITLICAATFLPLFGDSIDDAEAKRRSVPVAQVQAENALAAEKRKTADLEKQIAALKKKLEETTSRAAIDSAATLQTPSSQAAASNATSTLDTIRETIPAGVVRADELLTNFPANVARMASKGSKIIVQGRFVFQGSGPRAPVAPGEKQPVNPPPYIWILGTNQDGNDPAHVTCQLEATAQAKLQGAQYGTIVRVTGIVADTEPETGMVKLTHCDSLEVIPQPPRPSGAQFVGKWWGQYPAPASMKGDFQFKSDHTMTATFTLPGNRFAALAGKWQPKGEENKITFTLDKTDGPVELEMVGNRLHVPSIVPLYYLGGDRDFVEFRQHDGPPINASLAQAQNQLLQWVKTNCESTQQQMVLKAATKLISDAAPKKGNFSLTLDGQLTHSHKTTELCVSEDELFVFEYNDAQAKACGLAAGASQGVVRGEDYRTGDNAMKIESVTLDNGGSLDATGKIKGKAVLRAITQGGVGGSNLVMVCGGKRDVFQFSGGAGLDNMTVEFSFQPLVQKPNDESAKKHFGSPVVICFFMSTEVVERDSNVIAKLVDVNY